MKSNLRWLDFVLIMLFIPLYLSGFDVNSIINRYNHITHYILKFKEKQFDNNHVVTKIFNGMPIIVHKMDNYVCKSIRNTGYWDPTETKAILPLFKPGQTVVEIGANYGYYTLLMAEKIGKSGKLISYEANPDVYKYLIKSIAMNKLTPPTVIVKNLAVTDQNDDAILSYGFDNIGSGFISNKKDMHNICFGNPLYPICHTVKTTSLDQDLGNINIDILRMDAEGSEYFILQGAKNIIRNSPKLIIIMEWGKIHFQRANVDIDNFVKQITEQKYFIYNITPLGLTKIEPNNLLDIEFSNIILSKQSIL